ncbi:uncharacterized protein LOC134528451 [Bacillus rossius redtenbacheri]|uniref:uncharacterized protein LOC134528451 n=1 Tax=Bacillus rossius redtenbacheri TaxID=93214 RepID=UPI002FDE8EE3
MYKCEKVCKCAKVCKCLQVCAKCVQIVSEPLTVGDLGGSRRRGLSRTRDTCRWQGVGSGNTQDAGCSSAINTVQRQQPRSFRDCESSRLPSATATLLFEMQPVGNARSAPVLLLAAAAVVAVLATRGAQALTCPEGGCSAVTCDPAITEQSCVNGQFQRRGSACGCCDICRPLSDLNEPCDDARRVPVGMRPYVICRDPLVCKSGICKNP